MLLSLVMDVSNQGAHRWSGLAVLSTLGATLRVPESDENRVHFTLPSSGGHRESAYPQARVVGLMALGSLFLLSEQEFPEFREHRA